jgi:hypothetical protein
VANEILSSLVTTSARLLAMAVTLVGSTQKVRVHMSLTEAELVALLAGERELTWVELDLLTTLLVNEQAHVIAQNRELVELIRLRATRKA